MKLREKRELATGQKRRRTVKMRNPFGRATQRHTSAKEKQPKHRRDITRQIKKGDTEFLDEL